MSSTTPLGQLLSQSVELFKKHMVTIAVGALVLGILIALAQGFLAVRVRQGATQMMQQMQIDPNQMEDIQKRMEAGDETAGADLQKMMEKNFEGMNKEQTSAAMAGIGIKLFLQSLPFIGVSMLVVTILSLIGSFYYFFVALDEGTMQESFHKALTHFFPLLGMGLWIFLRSFVWIPFVGIIIAIFLWPRFTLSPIIMMREKLGVFDSVRASYKRTEGLWGKIVGNMIVAGVLVWVVAVVLSIVFSIISREVGFFLNAIVMQGMIAFLVIFKTKLALTVLGNTKA
jgi:hypothetical protein